MQTFDGFSYIYGAVRTPIGRFNGVFAGVPATDLAACAIREVLARSSIPADKIDEVILGNVLPGGEGQAPARQAAIKGGLGYRTGALTVNRVCGSGLQAVMLADDAIRLQSAEFVIAGGMESMSRAPILQMGARQGFKMESWETIDSIVHDGLWDSFLDCHMGEIAEKLAREGNYSRKAQDDYALMSYNRARTAEDTGVFADEIVAVTVESQGEKTRVEKDEQPYARDLAKLTRLLPVFVKEGGTVTAGNASSINDGAAVLILGPYNPNLKPLARIVAQSAHSREPAGFPLAPTGAIENVLRQWGVSITDIDLFEINEAFAVTTLAVCDMLKLSLDKVNVNGGAVALGHPIGASGARILVTLLYALRARNLRRGIAAICLGGGEAVAVGIEMMG
jgi:acetyl-CoA C-acetyltransferase